MARGRCSDSGGEQASASAAQAWPGADYFAALGDIGGDENSRPGFCAIGQPVTACGFGFFRGSWAEQRDAPITNALFFEFFAVFLAVIGVAACEMLC